MIAEHRSKMVWRSLGSFFSSGNIFPWGKKQLLSSKRPGINVKLHLDLGILLFPGKNGKNGIPVEKS